MQRILFVTGDPAHRFLYERGLKQCFQVAFIAPGGASAEPVAAVVYDLGTEAALEHLTLIGALDVPVVVLTPNARLPIPAAARQVVLEYPVSSQQLLEALASLGITP